MDQSAADRTEAASLIASTAPRRSDEQKTWEQKSYSFTPSLCSYHVVSVDRHRSDHVASTLPSVEQQG